MLSLSISGLQLHLPDLPGSLRKQSGDPDLRGMKLTSFLPPQYLPLLPLMLQKELSENIQVTHDLV